MAMIIVVGITLVFQLAGVVAYSDFAGAYLAFPGNETYGEGPILYQLEWLRSLGTMYLPLAEPPYAVSNYPPVFHIATWFLTTFFDDPLTAGRLVSLLSTLASCLLIFDLVYSQSSPEHSRAARALGGTLAALFFMSHYTVTQWSVMARVDMLAIALGLLGIRIFFLSVRRRSYTLACLFGLIFVAAAFTKQNMIAAGAATFVMAFFVDRRQAYTALAVSILAGLIVTAVLQAHSEGEFLRHAFYYNFNDLQWDRIGEIALVFMVINPVEILILIYGAAYLHATRNRRRGHFLADLRAGSNIPLILISVFMAASLLNVGASLKEGAAPNYYLEFQAAASVLAGLIVVRIVAFLRQHRMDPYYHKYSLGVVLSLSILVWQVAYSWDERYGHPNETIAPNMEQVIELAASVDGPVISEDIVLLYRTGRPLFYQPFIMTRLTLEGRWNAAPVMEKLRRGEVPMIILSSGIDSRLHKARFTPDFTDALKTHYRLLEGLGHFTVYVPS